MKKARPSFFPSSSLPPVHENLVDAKSVALFLSISVPQVRNLTCNGTLKPIKVGKRRVRYLISEVKNQLKINH
jgi:hypothetical protein